jgi:hypothetical protein
MDQAMMDRFNLLKKEFDEVCRVEQQKLVRPAPEVLYHYTNVRGFMGILSSGELQVSNILYMNDASELKYGRDLVEKLFVKLRSDVEELPGLLSSLDLWLSSHVFAFSMSEDGNDLSQWKAYAGGLGGLAIGFGEFSNTDVEVNSSTPLKMTELLVNIVYEPCRQQSAVMALLTKALSIYRDLGKNIVQGDMRSKGGLNTSISNMLIEPIIDLILKFKHEGFRNEAEWRLLCIVHSEDANRVQYREGRMGLVPYVSVKLTPKSGVYIVPPRMPIRVVVQGPTSEPNIAEKALRGYLDRRNYKEHTEIRASTVPLRF